jgi:APA family basic amino acid/polyamine antiporter
MPPTDNSSPQAARIAWPAAAALVVGNMVGVGVFTSLGFQLAGISSGFSILLLWAIGGAYALCGALCYAELVAAIPRSGGEYHLLSSLYHPAAGFLSGWISLTAGFAAPVAIAARLFGKYLGGALDAAGWETWLGAGVLVAVTAAHLWKLSFGGGFQMLFTGLKFGLVALLAVAGFANAGGGTVSFAPAAGEWSIIASGGFAVSLFYVNYAYAGWNAASYVCGEIREPSKGVPKALIAGTCAVLVLYLLVNMAFLASTPAAEMAGVEEVGLTVARHLFGDSGGALVGGLIAFGLISTISAMTWAGPRVGQMLGQDYPAMSPLARCNRNGIPTVAIAVQSGVALAMLVWVRDLKSIVLFLEFVLNLSLAATVAGVIWLRRKKPNLARPYRCPGYPLVPILFLAMAAYLNVRLLIEHPTESAWGIAYLALGGLVYLGVRKGYRSA